MDVTGGAGEAGRWEVVRAQSHPKLREQVFGYRASMLGLDAPRRRLELPMGVTTLFWPRPSGGCRAGPSASPGWTTC